MKCTRFGQRVRAKRYIRGAAATIIVPFLITLVTGNAQALYRCGGDRVARSECCCPKSPPTPVTSVVSDACCCSVETASALPVEARAQADRFESVTTFPSPVGVLSHVAAFSASRMVARLEPRSPRPADPSTLLALKTSFLR
jgi:hypothetical protein